MARSKSMSAWRKNRRRQIWNRDNGCCWLCGVPVSLEEMTIDHQVPRSKGGTGALSNLRAAHSWCNNLRGDSVEVTQIKYERPPLSKPKKPKILVSGLRPRGPIMEHITNESVRPLTTDERIALQKCDEEARKLT